MINNRICEVCESGFYEKPYRIAMGRGRFCSKDCFNKHQKGSKHRHKKGDTKICETCNKEFYVRKSASSKRRFCSEKCSTGNLGYKTSDATKVKLRVASLFNGNKPPSAKGKKFTIEHRRKIGRSGEKNPKWKGGITSENKKVRSSFDYKNWRRLVFERDHYECVICGSGNSNGKRTPLQADHIKPFAYFPGLRLEISNGRTLCIPCHKNTETYLNRWAKKQNLISK